MARGSICSLVHTGPSTATYYGLATYSLQEGLLRSQMELPCCCISTWHVKRGTWEVVPANPSRFETLQRH